MNKTTKIHFPFYGWIGLFLVILFWVLNWSLDGLRTHWGFFPLWLGYSIFMDALVFSRKGTSLIKRNWKLFAGLFLISVPVWWLFELFNLRTQNWFYDGKQYFTDLEYFLLSSLSFSTVMPSVFGTAEFTGTFKWIKNLNITKRLMLSSKTIFILLTSGFLILILIITLPKIFYPFVWISVFLLVEPLNIKLKNNSLLEFTASGKWNSVFALAAGSLICGFFWEMWNYFSYPQWKYYLPGVNILHVFEMPFPGYIGYLFFPFELFALYNFITGIFAVRGSKNYLSFSHTNSFNDN